jgi:hypothetical protein
MRPDRIRSCTCLEWFQAARAATDADKQWRAGNNLAVCGYVVGDVRLTADVVNAIAQARRISWITMRGTPSSVSIPRLRTVEDCMGDPMPDQSWMSDPLREEKFTGWLCG